MQARRLQKLECVEVHWVDIVDRSGWRSMSKAKKAKCDKCRTVGYVIKSSRKTLNIAGTVSGSQCNVVSIPWGVIFKIVRKEDGTSIGKDL